MRILNWLRHFRPHKPSEPLPGITLDIVEMPNLRFGPSPGADVEEIEIGSTGPGELQFVLISRRRRATVKLSAEQARLLAGALSYWADDSKTIPVH
jgi:hypothetical protein